MKKRPAPDFESDLAELEQLVARMERGDLSLEEALRTFERGVALAKSCQTALQEAEQKVLLLNQAGGSETLAPLPQTQSRNDETLEDEDDL